MPGVPHSGPEFQTAAFPDYSVLTISLQEECPSQILKHSEWKLKTATPPHPMPKVSGLKNKHFRTEEYFAEKCCSLQHTWHRYMQIPFHRYELRASVLTQHWHRKLTSCREQFLEKKVKHSASTLRSSYSDSHHLLHHNNFCLLTVHIWQSSGKESSRRVQ